MVTRYAEGTTVSVDTSRGELSGILAKHGVTSQGWYSRPTEDMLHFELAGHAYKMVIVKPTQADIFEMFPNHRDTEAKIAAEWRRRWRATVLLLKAKLEFASGEPEAVLRELMPYALLTDGRTLEEAIRQDALPMLEAG